jgi:hypothetical protein
MACNDVLSLQDLQTAKKHDLFHNEVITGKAGIVKATNQVTGQVQTTLPETLRQVGFKPASFTFVTGGTLQPGDNDLAVHNPAPAGDGNYYSWGGALPKVVAPGSTPATSGGLGTNAWIPRTDAILRHDLGDFESYGTTIDVASGRFPVGRRVTVTDRALSVFLVQSGGVADGFSTINAGGGNTATLLHNGTVYIEQLGGVPGTNITPLIIHVMANNDIKDFLVGAGTFNIDETWPYFPPNGKSVRGIPGQSILNYVGVAGVDAANMVEVIKLRSPTRDPISRANFTGFRLNLNNIQFIRGISLVYFTNQSTFGDCEVENVASNSEGVVLDKMWYTRWKPFSISNTPSAKVGKGLVIRPTVDSLSSINAHQLNVKIIGMSDNILFDTTTAAINTINIVGSSESGTNGVTHVGTLGVTEASIDLHMEGNLRNVRWEGTAGAGPGRIEWKGTWNTSNTGDVKLGNSDHYFEVRTVGDMNLYKWATARVYTLGSTFVDKGGTAGVEESAPVTYTFIEEVKSFPGWRPTAQSFVSTTQGKYSKGAGANQLVNTTGYVQFDFSTDLSLVSGYGAVVINAAYLRGDGSRKSYQAIALKRPADATNYLLTSVGGDALDANFDVQLTVAGMLRIKSNVAESVLYVGKVDPF